MLKILKDKNAALSKKAVPHFYSKLQFIALLNCLSKSPFERKRHCGAMTEECIKWKVQYR